MVAELGTLVGRTVTALYMQEGEYALVLDTDAGELTYEAIGECCSESWFADILGVSALLGHRVNAVETRDLPETGAGRVLDPKRSRQEYDEIYGIQLTTDAGRCDIIFRNSSNGYYGGWLQKVEAVDARNGRLYQITEDWSA